MTGATDPLAGSGIDTAVPHSARMWNYWLGGKDDYAVDREAGDAWIAQAHQRPGRRRSEAVTPLPDPLRDDRPGR